MLVFKFRTILLAFECAQAQATEKGLLYIFCAEPKCMRHIVTSSLVFRCLLVPRIVRIPSLASPCARPDGSCCLCLLCAVTALFAKT